jgi:siroheme synthase
LTGFGGGERVDRDQILRLLGEREAAGRAEVLRLEQEAARITGLIEECRREVDRVAIASEVLSGLVAEPAEAVPAGRDLKPDAVFADQLLAVLVEAGRPVRCRDVVAALGEDPAVARHTERVRHRLKKLVTAGRVSEVEPGLFTLAGDSGRSAG